MNFKKIDILLGMKDIQRLPQYPPSQGVQPLGAWVGGRHVISLVCLRRGRCLRHQRV